MQPEPAGRRDSFEVSIGGQEPVVRAHRLSGDERVHRRACDAARTARVRDVGRDDVVVTRRKNDVEALEELPKTTPVFRHPDAGEDLLEHDAGNANVAVLEDRAPKERDVRRFDRWPSAPTEGF
jgi:hypothetical protein